MMNLENESAYQELLQVHERDNENNNGYEYQLHDPNQKNKSCLSFKELKQRLTYTIPDQDEISKKKAKISKIQLIVCLVAFGCLLFGLWAYNARNITIDFKFDRVLEIELPVLTLCVPNFIPINKSPHIFMFREFNLNNVSRPGQLNRNNIIHHCFSENTPSTVENQCSGFIEYDGSCIHIGTSEEWLWSLKTGGRTLLSIILVYQPEIQSTMNLILPFFGWNSTCHGNQSQDDDSCTKIDDQHFGINDLEVKNPFVLYQLAPNQLLLADIKQENHITSHGVKSTIYPTSFVSFPFDPQEDFNDFCRQLNTGSAPCNVLYFGLRSLSKTMQTTREENYLSRVIRTIATATSQISLITTIAAVLFGYFVTRLSMTQGTAYIDHDLREPVLFMLKTKQPEYQATSNTI